MIKHYEGFELDKNEIKNLSHPARKFLKRKDLNDECKIDLLELMINQLNIFGQNTVYVNDVEARWLHNKKGLKELSYNVQSAVDTQFKLICAIKVS